MDFEWDGAKELANRKKHGVDFRTAAKVFLDPYVIEFDDLDAAGELRFNSTAWSTGPSPAFGRHGAWTAFEQQITGYLIA